MFSSIRCSHRAGGVWDVSLAKMFSISAASFGCIVISASLLNFRSLSSGELNAYFTRVKIPGFISSVYTRSYRSPNSPASPRYVGFSYVPGMISTTSPPRGMNSMFVSPAPCSDTRTSTSANIAACSLIGSFPSFPASTPTRRNSNGPTPPFEPSQHAFSLSSSYTFSSFTIARRASSFPRLSHTMRFGFFFCFRDAPSSRCVSSPSRNASPMRFATAGSPLVQFFSKNGPHTFNTASHSNRPLTRSGTTSNAIPSLLSRRSKNAGSRSSIHRSRRTARRCGQSLATHLKTRSRRKCE
mmetsp:Transcript_2317/g.7455  ORF Transcript_2317/g.7455 Transcript_2317/m.7455 type:complete len:298 (-) Transcript_2317:257-1150(-)